MARDKEKRSCGQVLAEWRAFVWDPRSRQVLGRTGTSWGRSGILGRGGGRGERGGFGGAMGGAALGGLCGDPTPLGCSGEALRDPPVGMHMGGGLLKVVPPPHPGVGLGYGDPPPQFGFPMGTLFAPPPSPIWISHRDPTCPPPFECSGRGAYETPQYSYGGGSHRAPPNGGVHVGVSYRAASGWVA